MFDLKSKRPTFLLSIPSILTVPCIGDKRNKADIRDDLPAPVLPTTPT